MALRTIWDLPSSRFQNMKGSKNIMKKRREGEEKRRRGGGGEEGGGRRGGGRRGKRIFNFCVGTPWVVTNLVSPSILKVIIPGAYTQE